MTLAHSARLTIDPKRLLENPWVHDMAHLLLSSVRQAREFVRRRAPKKKA